MIIIHWQIREIVNNRLQTEESIRYSGAGEIPIEIAMLICGDKYYPHKALVVINSAILFSKSKINFHLVVEPDSQKELELIVIISLFFLNC